MTDFQTSPQARFCATTRGPSPAGTPTTRPAGEPSTPTSAAPAGSTTTPDGHARPDAHGTGAVGGQTSPPTSELSPPKRPASAGTTAPAATIAPTLPTKGASLPDQPDPGHGVVVSQSVSAGVADLPDGQRNGDVQGRITVGESNQPTTTFVPTPKPDASSAEDPPGPAKREPAPTQATPALADLDGLLALAADVLDDLEKVRIANENRLRQLTRSQADADGEVRGFGLDPRHPDVARLAALVDMLGEAEHKAELNLKRLMRQHPLGPWVKTTVGIGEKQAARLLAAIGDPYIRPLIERPDDGTVEPSRPRTVSELWAYCGYHVVPADHLAADAQGSSVGGEQAGSHPDHATYGTQTCSVGVAPSRRRGQHANWSTTAKMRAYLIAESCVKATASPFRTVYNDTRQKYAGALHRMPCVRCGPKGNPAPTGSPLSPGHQHARALRAVAKEVLKDLWREARRLHEPAPTAIGPPMPKDRTPSGFDNRSDAL